MSRNSSFFGLMLVDCPLLVYSGAVYLRAGDRSFMCRLAWIFLASFLWIACSQDTRISSLPQDKFIRAYFNHRETTATYIEPYRQIERSGDNLEAVIIQAIAEAKFSIDIAVQELNLPLVAQALAAKKPEGVRVRVILDNNYSRSFADLKSTEIRDLKLRDRHKYQQYVRFVDLDKNGQLSSTEIAQTDALKIIREAGIEIIDDTADGSKGSGLMHHKFIVVDRQTVITGSANFTWSGLFGDPNNLASRGNVNHLLRIDNERVASLFTEEFNYMWGNPKLGIKSQFGLAKPWRSPQSISWQDTEVVVQFAPTSSKQDWSFSTNGAIGKAIDNARESIDLALFVFSEQEIANLLQSKSQQGIEVRGVFDAGFAYRYYSEVLDLLGIVLLWRCQPEPHNNPWVNPLKTIGTARTNSGDKLHHKFTVIDRETIISGSQNWSAAANYQNDEAIIIIKNLTVEKHFYHEFLRLYNSAELSVSATLKHKIQQQHKCK